MMIAISKSYLTSPLIPEYCVPQWSIMEVKFRQASRKPYIKYKDISESEAMELIKENKLQKAIENESGTIYDTKDQAFKYACNYHQLTE